MAYFENPPGSAQLAERLGISFEEFESILQKLGRIPNFTELSMFSAMWSEHCSYKNSILLLKTIYSRSELLLAKPGEENAGAIRINDRYALVFKIESHNHPSAIEPYQGAATGVGGIMRDIFTMGARPIASLNSLRFGSPDRPKNQYLLRRVVKGIGDYGNSLGIACIGGELFFDDSYTKNPLVNAMCIGVAEIGKMASSKAFGAGSLVVYVGAKTGRDGMHGASFASKELSENSEEERSAVQVGDPFLEKLLMEATLECIQKKLLISIQDMGAAGLLSSSSEMANAGRVGLKIDTSLIPGREANMQPYEFLLSESQERMLMITKVEKFPQIKSIFQKWGLDAQPIGEVISERRLQIFYKDEIYADIPPGLLTSEAPKYKRESLPPKKFATQPKTKNKKTGPKLFHKAVEKKNVVSFEKLSQRLMSSYNLASRRQVYEQYDTEIGASRLLGPGQNAGLIHLDDENIGIAATVDCRSDYVAIEPYLGAQHCVAEAYRNIISTGATPIGITNCLNFANPYKPENFYFFEQAVKGMSKAAEFFEIPITGGNVSFYNESPEGVTLPTPVIGMVGVHKNPGNALSLFLKPGQKIYLLGDFSPEIGSSVYQSVFFKRRVSPLPSLNLKMEKEVAKIFLDLFQKEKIVSAVDLSLGGLFAALLKMIFASLDCGMVPVGFRFEKNILPYLMLNTQASSYDELLWGESAHSYLVSTNEYVSWDTDKVRSENVRLFLLGEVIKEKSISFSFEFKVNLESIYEAWKNGLSCI